MNWMKFLLAILAIIVGGVLAFYILGFLLGILTSLLWYAVVIGVIGAIGYGGYKLFLSSPNRLELDEDRDVWDDISAEEREFLKAKKILDSYSNELPIDRK